MSAIELVSLRKQFGGVVALRDVDLTVREGEVFGFLGPNGAGKSTTIDVLLDYVRPTAGEARVFGLDAQADGERARRRIGALPDMALFDHLTARQHVSLVADVKSVDEDPIALLRRVSLHTVADRRVEGFSKGMRQRLLLAMALVGEPDLLILDEPSTGLDPNGAREMQRIVREENARGATVFFSSHILEQVEAVCDRVGILDDGKLVAVDTLDGLQSDVGSSTVLTVTVDELSERAVAAVRAVEGTGEVRVEGRTLSVSCPDERKVEVIDAIRSDGATVRDLDTSDASLSDLFATYTAGATA
ncbi:ABC transporter ATP-binding protein [Halomarina pelagica]|uniref:ABC transporter ATP-binding protein n=1 Tax=Halomarina pelagica TaxID=2961599 RepID=UPI0020C2E2FB|nr:ABC transporter ATP-binding protein [Halomarina sp. BND7]